MRYQDFETAQRNLCGRYAMEFMPINWDLRVAIADDFFSDVLPKNGLRRSEVGNMTGWYLWAGETLSTDADYFKPYCAIHLTSRWPEVLPYLGLPEGSRFLLAPGQVDVWFDETLLDA